MIASWSAASDYPLSELAKLWALTYEDYFVPIHEDAEQLARHIEGNDVDLTRSIVARSASGDFVGMSFLGRRGDRGWIGGFGIAAPFRRRGLAGELIAAQLERARGEGIVSVQLEVLEQNWASKVYEAAGFVTRRRLYGLRATLPASPAPPAIPLTSPADALAVTARLRAGLSMAWQREPASVAYALGRGARPFMSSDGASMVVLGAEGVRVLDDAGDPEALVALLAHLAGGQPVTVSNEPEDSPLVDALLARGFERMWTQREMIAG